MQENREIAISTSDVFGKDVICYQSTFNNHKIKHPEPFSEDDVIECVANPDIVAKSGHNIKEHEERLLYYKEKRFEDAPTMMKTIVDHAETPGVVTSMFRTSKYTQDGAIVHIREDYFKENGK